MIQTFRDEHGLRPHPHVPPGDLKICICVRKRPINEKERRRKDYDAVTCFNPVVRRCVWCGGCGVAGRAYLCM